MGIPPNNIAYIDGQNLHMGTGMANIPWNIDLNKFRIYLLEKFKVKTAYYFIGFYMTNNQDLYEEIKNAGFTLMFRQHSHALLGKKKGNVDSDIIFHIMEAVYYKLEFQKIIIVSGDGDYKKLIDFLIKEDRLERILFPCREKTSSLYKTMSTKYHIYIDKENIKTKISK